MRLGEARHDDFGNIHCNHKGDPVKGHIPAATALLVLSVSAATSFAQTTAPAASPAAPPATPAAAGAAGCAAGAAVCASAGAAQAAQKSIAIADRRVLLTVSPWGVG
jgi:hypothetical protein